MLDDRGKSPSMPDKEKALINQGFSWFSSGEGEIRTPATIARRPVFETGAFSRSATSPGWTADTSGYGILRQKVVRAAVAIDWTNRVANGDMRGVCSCDVAESQTCGESVQ